MSQGLITRRFFITLSLHPSSIHILQNPSKSSPLWSPCTSRITLPFSSPPTNSIVYNMLMTNIILTLTNILSLTHFKIILDLFKMLFGLKINYPKSHDFKLGAISDTQINVTSSILKCQIGSFPLSYWAFPSKLASWIRQTFCLLLVKLDATCHPGKDDMWHLTSIYYMSFFLLPKWVINKIDKIRQTFLWTGSMNKSSKAHLANWHQVYASKSQGGQALEISNSSIYH